MTNSKDVPLTPGQLVCDFGPRSPATRAGVAALYQRLAESGRNGSHEAVAQWRDLLQKTCGPGWLKSARQLEGLAGRFDLPAGHASAETVLLALQTWYVGIVRLVAGHVVARHWGAVSPAERLLTTAGSGREDALAALATTGRGSLAEMGLPPEAVFSWPFSEPSRPLADALAELARRVVGYEPEMPAATGVRQYDLFKPLYQALFPPRLRHALGEYYTPDWLAEHVLDQVGYSGDPHSRLVDPTCGSGTFLLAAIARCRNGDAASCPPWQQIARNIVGFDLHPLAATTARANWLLAVADLVPPGTAIEVPIYRCDAVLEGPGAAVVGSGFDYVVGNPPWLAWDHLPADYRQATKSLWEGYGLFSLSAREARHGGGKKDLAMLVLYRSADRYLRSGGRLGMVVTQTLLQTKGAGDGFRRFRLGPEGDWLGVLRVDDFVAVRPFGDASNWTATIVLEKGRPTSYPVPYVKWGRLPTCREEETPLQARQVGNLPHVSASYYHARPIDATRPGSPWIICPEGSQDGTSDVVGRADYTAHLGANSGGANGVYWLEVLGRADNGVRVRNLVARGKGKVELVETVLEPDRIYPLVRWIDVDRYAIRPSAHLLLVQDPETRSGVAPDVLRRDCPRTFEYLKRFERLLTARAAYRRYQDGRPFYSMYNVGVYTLAPVKVVWRRMDRRVRAAVVTQVDDPHLGRRPIVPQETCVLVPCDSVDEAHYLCALLNSETVDRLVAAHSVAGGKGFGTPSMLDYLPLRRFCGEDARHAELAACSRRAHELRATGQGSQAGRGGEDEALAAVQGWIDQLAAEVCGMIYRVHP